MPPTKRALKALNASMASAKRRRAAPAALKRPLATRTTPASTARPDSDKVPATSSSSSVSAFAVPELFTTPDLDRSATASPLHAQIGAWLRAVIRDHDLAAGSVLPSEAQLGERFGVARSVVRQALAGLVGTGDIVRQIGRAPMVAPPREHHRLVQRSTGMFDQFARTGVQLRTRVLNLGPARPPADVATFFGSTDLVLLERLRYVEDQPLALVFTWLPSSVSAYLSIDALTDASLHGLLNAHAGLRPGKGRNRIKAVAASPSQSEVLDMPAGEPLLLLEGRGCDQQGRPLEYFFTWHRSEHLVFDVDVTDDDEQLRRSLPDAEPALAKTRQMPTLDTAMNGGAPVVSEAAASALAMASGDPSPQAALARAEKLVAELAEELRRLKSAQP